jgi:hypothetical protein
MPFSREEALAFDKVLAELKPEGRRLTAEQCNDLSDAAEMAQRLAVELREMYEDALVRTPSESDWQLVHKSAKFVAETALAAQKGRS